MAKLTPQHRTWTAVGLLGVVAAITAGAWGLREWRPFAHATAPVRLDWPENVEPVAGYVTGATALDFLRPVRFEFIPDSSAYDERVEGNTRPPLDAFIDDEALGRALGLLAGDDSLVDARRAMAAAGDFSVTWLRDGTVVIRADSADATLPPPVRAELTVRLTQILHEQHYDLPTRLEASTNRREYAVLAALDLGQALWVHDRYVDELPLDEARGYYESVGSNPAIDALDFTTPASLRAVRLVSQVVGPVLFEALQESGQGLADQAFMQPPDALDQIALPATKYLRRDPLEAVAAPPVPRGGDLVSSDTMGPFVLYLMLSSAMPPTAALEAADGWGNDAYTSYRLDDRTCVDLRIAADSRDDADLLHTGISSWAAARPAESDALVGRRGTTILASMCDPGVDVRQPVPTEAAADHFFGRAGLIRQETDATGRPVFAECVAVTLFDRFDVVAIESGESEIDVFEELIAIEDDCRSSA